MKFGYCYDCRNPARWRKPWDQFYAETLEFMAWTESIGFEGIWVPEHHGSEDGYLPSPLVMLAAIAARTRTARIGSTIALAPLYQPVRFAEDCALLDILSAGRLDMAIGVGYRRRETDAYGVPFKARGSRTDEFIQIVRALWAGQTVNHDSQHFKVRNAVITPRPLRGQVPLYIGGFTERALQRAALYGDGYHGAIEGYGSYVDKLRECGKDPASARLRAQDPYLFVARDPAQAMEELAPHAHYMYMSYVQWQNEDRTDYDLYDINAVLKPMSLDEFKATGPIRVLTPDQAISHFRQMASRAPVEHFMLFVPPGLPLPRFAHYAEVFAQEVIPAFKSAR